ncbi:MAG: TorF family putative porin [Syntrophotaleaceae bacterium]
MKKWSVLFVALVMIGAGMVNTSQAAIEVEGDVYAGVFDKYLWRGFDLSEGRPVLQGGIDLSFGNWTLSTWHNWQLKSGPTINSGELNETDLILDYSFDVGEMLSVSVGNIWYMLDFEGAEDTNELYAGATVNTLLSPTVTMYWDWDACEEDGLFFTFDVSHSFDLMEGLSLGLGALVSYNQHSDYAVGDYSGFHHYELSAGLDYTLTESLTLSPSFVFSSGIDDDAKDSIDSEILAGVTLTFAF